jgi:hypothetical protein
MDMYIWHVDFTNAFAEADRPEKIYYMRCTCVFQDWWVERHPGISLPPVRLFLSSRTSMVIMKARASRQFVAIWSF